MAWLNSLKELYRNYRVTVRVAAVGSAALAVMTLIAMTFDLKKDFAELWRGWFGRDDESIVVLQARLNPFPWPRGAPLATPDQYFLYLRLRNQGATPIWLTAADIAVAHARLASVGTGGIVTGALSKEPNKNTPIALLPGRDVWVSVSQAVYLPKASNWLTPSRREKIHLMPEEGEAYAIGEIGLVDDLNAALAKLYGSKAQIRVTLYTQGQEKVRELSFDLAKGKDLFACDGSLQHDAMIAAWMMKIPRVSGDGGVQCGNE